MRLILSGLVYVLMAWVAFVFSRAGVAMLHVASRVDRASDRAELAYLQRKAQHRTHGKGPRHGR